MNDPGRSRDDAGRPRNDRPRDHLGRPLPPGSVGVEPVPDELDLPVDEAIDYAQRLLDEDRAFGAHEVLEAVWKAAPEPERELWRSLAQLAVGVTHLQRGNLRGSRELTRRAVAGLQPWRGQQPHGLAVDGLTVTGEELLAALDGVDETGARPSPPPVPHLRLRG